MEGWRDGGSIGRHFVGPSNLSRPQRELVQPLISGYSGTSAPTHHSLGNDVANPGIRLPTLKPLGSRRSCSVNTTGSIGMPTSCGSQWNNKQSCCVPLRDHVQCCWHSMVNFTCVSNPKKVQHLRVLALGLPSTCPGALPGGPDCHMLVSKSRGLSIDAKRAEIDMLAGAQRLRDVPDS